MANSVKIKMYALFNIKVKHTLCRQTGSKTDTNLVWQYLVQSVAVTAQCNSAVGRHVVYIYVLVEVNDKLTFWMNLVHSANNKSMKSANTL